MCGDTRSVTVIGDTVNVASRVEQANKDAGTRLLVSDTVLEELADAVVTGRSVCCALPGKSGEHTLVEVVGMKEREAGTP